jgi:SAM-dependent methyltransferase
MGLMFIWMLDRKYSEELHMDHMEVRRHWNYLAPTWTAIVRNGYDYYRDYLNTPAFLEILPSVKGLEGLDLGCGEGHNTRALVELGANMFAIDVSDVFVRYAAEIDCDPPIHYSVASGLDLPFPPSSFDFVTGFMSFMDIPGPENLFGEVYRVLKSPGFVQFSIMHPCFDTPHRKKLRHADGTTYAYEIGDYFKNLNGDLILAYKPKSRVAQDGYPPLHIPRFTRTLSQWTKMVLDAGFVIERINEPEPSDEDVKAHPELQDAQVIPYFLHIRASKPS